MSLINGKIPAHTECPYKDKCEYKKSNTCHHQGKGHPREFSCGIARGFSLDEKYSSAHKKKNMISKESLSHYMNTMWIRYSYKTVDSKALTLSINLKGTINITHGGVNIFSGNNLETAVEKYNEIIKQGEHL